MHLPKHNENNKTHQQSSSSLNPWSSGVDIALISPAYPDCSACYLEWFLRCGVDAKRELPTVEKPSCIILHSSADFKINECYTRRYFSQDELQPLKLKKEIPYPAAVYCLTAFEEGTSDGRILSYDFKNNGSEGQTVKSAMNSTGNHELLYFVSSVDGSGNSTSCCNSKIPAAKTTGSFYRSADGSLLVRSAVFYDCPTTDWDRYMINIVIANIAKKSDETSLNGSVTHQYQLKEQQIDEVVTLCKALFSRYKHLTPFDILSSTDMVTRYLEIMKKRLRANPNYATCPIHSTHSRKELKSLLYDDMGDDKSLMSHHVRLNNYGKKRSESLKDVPSTDFNKSLDWSSLYKKMAIALREVDSLRSQKFDRLHSIFSSASFVEKGICVSNSQQKFPYNQYEASQCISAALRFHNLHSMLRKKGHTIQNFARYGCCLILNKVKTLGQPYSEFTVGDVVSLCSILLRYLGFDWYPEKDFISPEASKKWVYERTTDLVTERISYNLSLLCSRVRGIEETTDPGCISYQALVTLIALASLKAECEIEISHYSPSTESHLKGTDNPCFILEEASISIITEPLSTPAI